MANARQEGRKRGFTLVELLAVVVIMGILATIGLTSFVGYMREARTAEVRATISAIAAAQERYRAENMTYMNVSASLTSYYPTDDPGEQLYNFYGHTGGNDFANWERLKPQVPVPVRFGYATVAGLPEATWTPPTLALTQTVGWPATVVAPWYVIQAVGDLDGDGEQAVAVTTSFSNVVLWEHEGE
jgi:prepilin-type N-terminal cleavage/methylation domain-containing protein